MYIIGVDPGKTGGAAYMMDGNLITVTAFKGDIEKCRAIGIGFDGNPPVFFIEKVGASSNQGTVSAFTFGKWAESVESAAIHAGATPHMVRPTVWQNAIGVFSAGDKKVLYDHAKTLFPMQYAAHMFNKATADAVLIAYYGWRYMVNQEGGE